jgi:leader peptidase (prepilin peptidase)/N-methyltransferase
VHLASHLSFLLLLALLGGCVGLVIASAVDRLYPTDSSAAQSKRPHRRMVLLGIVSAVLFVVAGQRALDVRQFLLMSLFGGALLMFSATDFERRLLPNRLMYPCLVAALLLCWAWPQRSVLSDLAGGAAGTALMLAAFLALPGFGFGDVKLAGLIGLLLGFPAVLTALLVGMIFGGIGSSWLLLTKRTGLRGVMAYGPYLAGGAIVEMLLRR